MMMIPYGANENIGIMHRTWNTTLILSMVHLEQAIIDTDNYNMIITKLTTRLNKLSTAYINNDYDTLQQLYAANIHIQTGRFIITPISPTYCSRSLHDH